MQALASAPGTLKQQVDDGKMRVLANWGAERVASFPDLPTFRELGYKDVEFYIWAGLFAQSALPAPIMTRLREAMAQAVKAPEVIKTFETAGSPVAYLDAPEFSKFVAEDSARLDRGGEEDRQGRVAEPTSHFFVRANVAWPHSFDRLCVIAARNLRVIWNRKKGPRTCERSELS